MRPGTGEGRLERPSLSLDFIGDNERNAFMKKKMPISADIDKLDAIIELVPSDRRAVAEKLGKEITFMYRTLERLRQAVDGGEVVDLFHQGSQEFVRENPALKAYTNLIPKYSALYKQVTDLLPAASMNDGMSKLQEFLNESDS